MTTQQGIHPAGKLGILLPGMGAISTTFIAGVDAIRRGAAAATGSVAMLGGFEAAGPDGSTLRLRDALPFADLDDVVFGGWDIYEGDAFGAATRADVLKSEDLWAAKEVLRGLKPMSAVFSKDWIQNLDGPNVKTLTNKWDLAQALMDDIDGFKAQHGCDRLVAVWCASTERFAVPAAVHESIESFELGLRESHPQISPSMIYTYALIKRGVPIANGAPNLTLDVPALIQLAQQHGVPIAGKDFKTGQTLMKTVLAPALYTRKLGVNGWYSTNILGNSDGLVLDDPQSFKTKENSKLSVLDSILDATQHPELYGDIHHKVRIDYYPPRGDQKEGWDNVDIFGWMGYPMQIKINFLCRDSILAAPLVLDLALMLDLAARAGESGVQEWLSFYFKAPQARGWSVVHDVFAQRDMLYAKLAEFAHRVGSLEQQ